MPLTIIFENGAPLHKRHETVTLIPVFMLLDGKRFFVCHQYQYNPALTRPGYDPGIESTVEVKGIKTQLIENGGAFFRFHGAHKPDPRDFLHYIKNTGCTLETTFQECFHTGSASYIDFGGTVKQDGSQFLYRIYSQSVYEELMVQLNTLPGEGAK